MSALYWLIKHAPKDVIFAAYDNIEKFVYRLDITTCLELKDISPDKEKITSEVERIAQLIYDLDSGYAFDQSALVPYAYTAEFRSFREYYNRCRRMNYSIKPEHDLYWQQFMDGKEADPTHNGKDFPEF